MFGAVGLQPESKLLASSTKVSRARATPELLAERPTPCVMHDAHEPGLSRLVGTFLSEGAGSFSDGSTVPRARENLIISFVRACLSRWVICFY